MIELIIGCMSGAALAFGLWAYIFGEKDRKRISKLEKKVNELDNTIKELQKGDK